MEEEGDKIVEAMEGVKIVEAEEEGDKLVEESTEVEGKTEEESEATHTEERMEVGADGDTHPTRSQEENAQVDTAGGPREGGGPPSICAGAPPGPQLRPHRGAVAHSLP